MSLQYTYVTTVPSLFRHFQPPLGKASLGTPLKESIKGGEGVGSVATST